MKKLQIYTDGGSRGNPGPAACGIIILDEQEKLVKLNAKYLGKMTNNQAEYEGVITALRMTAVMNVDDIDFFLDSDLMVKQLNGEYKVKSQNIKPLKFTIDKLLKQFQKVTFSHVRREYNKAADKLVNIVLDTIEKK